MKKFLIEASLVPLIEREAKGRQRVNVIKFFQQKFLLLIACWHENTFFERKMSHKHHRNFVHRNSE
jgi:hypothetical protein